jgi:hypothetical protein
MISIQMVNFSPNDTILYFIARCSFVLITTFASLFVSTVPRIIAAHLSQTLIRSKILIQTSQGSTPGSASGSRSRESIETKDSKIDLRKDEAETLAVALFASALSIGSTQSDLMKITTDREIRIKLLERMVGVELSEVETELFQKFLETKSFLELCGDGLHFSRREVFKATDFLEFGLVNSALAEEAADK